MEYFDSVFGRLLDHLIEGGLLDNTYIFLTGDNGSELFPSEQTPPNRAVRMPSKMVGVKTDITEGGNRQFLLVAGPGVPAGATDYTLTSIKDVMSTAIALAGGAPGSFSPSWQPDGISLHNLLRANGASSAAQERRMLFQLNPDCFWPDLVLPVGPDR
jgi:arylsulfatase A-like enzyme